MIFKMSLLCALLAACFLQVARCDDIPTIIGYIEPVVAKVGTDVHLNCTVSNLVNGAEAQWSFFQSRTSQFLISTGTKIEQNFNDRGDGQKIYEVRKTVTDGGLLRFTLWVFKVQLTETGVYQCAIRQQGNPDQPFINANVTVLSPPNIRVSASTITKNTALGETAELMCIAEGAPLPNVTWGRANGKPLPQDRIQLIKERPEGAVSQKLVLMNVTREDRGTYRCSADNNVRPPDDLFTKMNVDFPPSVEYVEENYGSIYGELADAILWCKVAGEPSPDLSWYRLTPDENLIADRNASEVVIDDTFYRNHRSLLDDQDYTIEQKLVLIGSLSTMDSTFYTLAIHAVAAEEFGWYVCSARNKYGRGHALIQLYQVNDFYSSSNQGSRGHGNRVGASLVLLSLLAGISTLWNR